MPIHEHVRKVNEYCDRMNQERTGKLDFSRKIDVPGKEIHSWSNYMTVFGHEGKAYVVSGMRSMNGELQPGQIRDITDVKLQYEGVGALGGSHGPSAETLNGGKLLPAEEAKKIWEEAGFEPQHVAKILHSGIGFGSSKLLRTSLENAGITLSKEEMRDTLDKANLFRKGARDKIVEEMYTE